MYSFTLAFRSSPRLSVCSLLSCDCLLCFNDKKNSATLGHVFPFLLDRRNPLPPALRTRNCKFPVLATFPPFPCLQSSGQAFFYLRCCFTWMLDRTAWVYLKRTGEFRETAADKLVRKKCRRYGKKIRLSTIPSTIPKKALCRERKGPFFLLLVTAGESPAKRWRECLGGLTHKSRVAISSSCRKKVFRSGPQGLGTPTGCISSCAKTSSRTRPFSGGEMTLNCAISFFFATG